MEILGILFWSKIGDQTKCGTKVCCNACSSALTGWLKGTHKSINTFVVAMVWKENTESIG